VLSYPVLLLMMGDNRPALAELRVDRFAAAHSGELSVTANTGTSLRETWRTCRSSIGLWHRLAHPRAAAIAAASGFDWLCIDAQHGPFDQPDVDATLRAANAVRTPAIVRVPPGDSAGAMKALDAGAHGILFPTVRSAAEVAELTAACRHPPRGQRSWAALGLGADAPAHADELIACGVMIETHEAIADLDAILQISELDFVFVGPDDLAISFGLPPSLEPSDSELVSTMERVAAHCKRAGVASGIYCANPRWASRWARSGFRILAAGGDEAVLRTGLRELAERTRAAVDGQPNA
jgi:4-hydroxy-2-oxoheptanedioate aldolase